jgi:hypothetical protein
VINDPNWRLQNNVTSTITGAIFTSGDNNDGIPSANPQRPQSIEDVHGAEQLDDGFSIIQLLPVEVDERTMSEKMSDMYAFMSQEPVCIWVSQFRRIIK